jgi:hypothetical protein
VVVDCGVTANDDVRSWKKVLTGDGATHCSRCHFQRRGKVSRMLTLPHQTALTQPSKTKFAHSRTYKTAKHGQCPSQRDGKRPLFLSPSLYLMD